MTALRMQKILGRGSLLLWYCGVLCGGLLAMGGCANTRVTMAPAAGQNTAAEYALRPPAAAVPLPVFRVVRFCANESVHDVVWVHVHENETTAWQVAQTVLAEWQAGCLYGLQHGGTRDVVVTRDGLRYRFDPNRMFTPQGRARFVQVQAGDATRVRAQVAAAADDFFQRYLAGATLIVAVHNNRIGGLSVHDYTETGSLARAAAAVHINPAISADDFFYTTSLPAYDFLVARGFNAVLQNNAQVADDGSLSVRAAHAGTDYINAEAGTGHVATQTAMLEAVVAYIQQLRPKPQ